MSYDDFDYIRELNKIITAQYDALIELIPTPAEISFLIYKMSDSYYYDKHTNDRIRSLKRLLRISKLTMTGHRIRISSYDEQVKRHKNINK